MVFRIIPEKIQVVKLMILARFSKKNEDGFLKRIFIILLPGSMKCITFAPA